MSAAPETATADPFPHLHLPDLLRPGIGGCALAWLRDHAPWRLRVADFYEQYEFSLLSNPPPRPLALLTSGDFIAKLAARLRASFNEPNELELVEIAAHRLVSGQTIRIHNDFVGDEETHRVLIQLNEGWEVDNGGLLMLFGSDRPEDVRAVLSPRHGSCLAFEISPASFHAVSKIHHGDRYTLVYTFKRRTD